VGGQTALSFAHAELGAIGGQAKRRLPTLPDYGYLAALRLRHARGGSGAIHPSSVWKIGVRSCLENWGQVLL